MSRATIAVTVVEMDDGRLALLVEMDPAPRLGPWVVDFGDGAPGLPGPNGLEDQS